MRAPETRYARNSEGQYIAYQTVGEGPRDIIHFSYIPCIDVMWEDARYAHALGRLARLGRLICFDWRGFGVSDPVPLGALPTIDAWSDDFRVVLDTVGSKSATLFAQGVGAGQVGVFIAATYPERTDALILANASARMLRSDDYPWGIPPSVLARTVESLEGAWGTEAPLFDVPSRADDQAFQRWYSRYLRLVVSPGTWRANIEWCARLDVRKTLQNVRVPTLVVHSRDNLVLRPDHGRYLADHIAGARFVLLDTGDVSLCGESDELLDHVEEFITGVPPVLESDRALATVLFTDIVASTDHASRVGDKRWAELLDRHDDVVHRELGRHRGKKVNPTGDGVLASFDGPARAVRCAQAIVEAVRPLGIEVRAGLHTGEVELRGDDIGGIAVHIGQRVSALAGPGEVLVSRTVADLVVGSGIRFEERGDHELKGIPGEWTIYAVSG